MIKIDILSALKDLQKQAGEQSHYYTRNVVRLSIKEIKRLRKENQELLDILEIYSDKKVIKGLIRALEDFKEGRFTVLEKSSQSKSKANKK